MLSFSANLQIFAYLPPTDSHDVNSSKQSAEQSPRRMFFHSIFHDHFSCLDSCNQTCAVTDLARQGPLRKRPKGLSPRPVGKRPTVDCRPSYSSNLSCGS